jgi:glyceraldehyde 3-phosphate dehydrogenase
MSKIRVAINGFGRIGRVTARALLKDDDIELVAVNDLTEVNQLAHLFKYDSVHGKYNGTVTHGDNFITIDEHTVYVYDSRDPGDLPWADLNIDVVIESTGIFRSHDMASLHIDAGAKKVIISAPAKGDDVKTVVIGINDEIIEETDTILSNASCTTNCAAPMVKILDELCGIESGYITTVHAYTGDQNIHDAPHSKDLRRARAAAVSIIPTTTGAAKAITRIFPHLEGNFGGCGIRVPVPDGSLTDITCIVKNPVSEEAILAAFKAEAEGAMKGILEYTEEPLVSIDIVGNTHSCIFDSDLISVIGNMVKVVGWYDNETGYSNRLLDLIKKVG